MALRKRRQFWMILVFTGRCTGYGEDGVATEALGSVKAKAITMATTTA